MNKAESERLGSYFEQLGYQPIANAEEADLIVVNSCVVRQSAENRVVNKLNALRPLKKSRPDLTIAVTGCLVNADVAQLNRRFPHVDYFFKPGDYRQWIEKKGVSAAGAKSPSLIPQHPSPCTFVPIIQGCDNCCSYCIVPYRRGG